MRIIPIVLAALVVSVGVAFAANGAAPTGDQGRRLSGPVCGGKPNAGANAGVVRSIAKTQTCRSYEIRKAGVAVPCASVTVNLVPTDPCLVVVSKPGAPGASGPQGGQGAKGDTGAAGVAGKDGKNGENGAQGATGPAGPKGDTGAAGAPGQAGATGETGATGAKGDTGATGAKGDTGAAGAAGLKGDTGPAGEDGANGLGDGTRWICKIGKGKGSLKDGGTDTNPDCVPGTDFAFKVVTSGAVNYGPFNGSDDS